MIYFYVQYLQPNMQSKLQKEGLESKQFWEILGGKSKYPSQKIARDVESDPHFSHAHFQKVLTNTKFYVGFNSFGYLPIAQHKY